MRLYFLLLFLLFNEAVRAQTAPLPDTLAYARAKAYGQDFAEADRILSLYNTGRRNVDGLRLQAQVLYWKQEFKRAAALHEQAIAAFPALPVLRLDYARLLTELGEPGKAQGLLRQCLAQDSLQAEAYILLARIHYQNLQLAQARQELATLLRHFPGNADALALRREIDQSTGPYVRVGSIFRRDDQPLTAWTQELEASWFRSGLLAPTVQVQANQFKLPEEGALTTAARSYWLQAGNKLSWPQHGLSLTATAGVFAAPPGGRPLRATGALQLTKKLSRTLALDLSTARQPYQYVLASVRQPVLENVAGGALRYSRAGNWLGKAGYDQRQYGDDNLVRAAYVWLLAPLVSRKTLTVQGGYSFAYATAAASTYTAVRSLAAVVAGGGAVEGRYRPYFTPKNQAVHALLLSARLTALPRLTVSGRGSFGVAGRADAPFLYLDKAGNDTFFFARGFSRQSYHPVEVHGEVALKATPSWSVATSYDYASLIFYRAHQAALQLQYHLVRDANN